MNSVLSIAFLGLALSSAQAAQSSDQFVTEVTCHNTSHLPSGLSVLIQTGGIAGITQAVLTNRDNLGPYKTLGTILVTRKPVPTGIVGAGLDFVGKDFSLHINTDGTPVDGGTYSEVYADIDGRVFNEPMICNFPVHAL